MVELRDPLGFWVMSGTSEVLESLQAFFKILSVGVQQEYDIIGLACL